MTGYTAMGRIILTTSTKQIGATCRRRYMIVKTRQAGQHYAQIRAAAESISQAFGISTDEAFENLESAINVVTPLKLSADDFRMMPVPYIDVEEQKPPRKFHHVMNDKFNRSRRK